MSELGSESMSEGSGREIEAIAPSSSNGVHHDADTDVIVEPETPVDEPASPTAALPAEPPASDASPTPSTAGPDAEPDDAAGFVAGLVRAVRETATLERSRVGEDIERRRQSRVDSIRAREASEVALMRELADEDMQAIDAWAEGETRRIQLEHERRAAELREDLAASLVEHRQKIDGLVEAVEAAIAAHRVEVDAFFDRLEGETDLVEIARLAAARPLFPALHIEDDGGAASGDASIQRASGTADPAAPERDLVGVIDPATQDGPTEAWSMSWQRSPAASGAEAAVEPEAPVLEDGLAEAPDGAPEAPDGAAGAVDRVDGAETVQASSS